ncbi:MAG: FliH/SctL family protein [Gammaproteobacteria bacterium]|nr:FliH/SctL family protein [Gammaproteobacteria bacterium]MDE0282966.1 FliH/SctL family protein [Gammaproteobacteria bacterium]MDE0510695.1 FliH/SctL family protein [Gammaproteobacteria bacterium]
MSLFSLPDYRHRIMFDRKIIKAEDYRAWLEARQLISAVKEQERQARERHEAVYEQQKKAGYEDGLEQAKAQEAELIFSTTAQVIEYISSIEQTLVRIVMTTLRRVFSDYDDAELVTRLIQNGLQQFREQANVKIHIPAGAQDRDLRARIQETMRAAGLPAAEIIENATLSGTGCRLESDMGSVDANLETFLQAMEAALNQHFAEQ